jgi:uncharacterized protein
VTDEQFISLKNKTFKRLKEELPDFLFYHRPEHTQRVFEQVKIIAEYEEIPSEDIRLLQVAALYHDLGFINTLEDHEEEGCRLAHEELTDYGLTDDEIERICGMITATRIPQVAHNVLEAILADADLEYLGTEDFETIGQQLYRELHHQNPDLTAQDFDKIQIRFLQQHSYLTHYGQRHLAGPKAANLERVIIRANNMQG